MTQSIPEVLKKPVPADENESTPLLPLPNSASPQQSTELTGYFLMAVSCLGFSGMSFCLHVGEDRYNFPTLPALFIRGIFHALLSILSILYYLPIRETFTNISTRQWKLLAVRGICGSIGMLFYFIALKKLPVGDGVTIFFCGPVIVMILSNIFLGEPITQTDCMAAVTSFIGIGLIARPDFGVASAVSPHDRIIGAICALSAAFGSSIAFVSIRSMGTRVHFAVSVLALGIAAMIISVLLGGAIGPTRLVAQKEGAILVALSAVFAFAGQCCLTRGLQLCRAGPGILIRNLDVPIAYILGILFLAEKPNLLRLVGSMFVLFSAFIIGAGQIVRARNLDG